MKIATLNRSPYVQPPLGQKGKLDLGFSVLDSYRVSVCGGFCLGGVGLCLFPGVP